MEEELIRIKNNALSMIWDTNDPEELEEIKLQFLGRSGQLTLGMKQLPKIDPEKRKEIGILVNDVKETIESALKEKTHETKTQAVKSHVSKIDVTNPGIKPPLGHLHLITQAISEIT